jgi:hypothetical protein
MLHCLQHVEQAPRTREQLLRDDALRLLQLWAVKSFMHRPVYFRSDYV